MSEVLTHRTFSIGDRYRVHHWTLTAAIQCLQCDAKPILRVVDGYETPCPSCGARYSLGGMRWDVTNPGATQLGVGASIPSMPEPTLTPQ